MRAYIYVGNTFLRMSQIQLFLLTIAQKLLFLNKLKQTSLSY